MTPDEFANLFNVQAFADQMSEIGVEYVIFTAWHRGIYNLGPGSHWMLFFLLLERRVIRLPGREQVREQVQDLLLV